VHLVLVRHRRHRPYLCPEAPIRPNNRGHSHHQQTCRASRQQANREGAYQQRAGRSRQRDCEKNQIGAINGRQSRFEEEGRALQERKERERSPFFLALLKLTRSRAPATAAAVTSGRPSSPCSASRGCKSHICS
ncbi:unnamed protein product, partial [Ectocarpus sp. 4 AP-2014]